MGREDGGPALTNAQFRALKAFLAATDDPAIGGTSAKGSTETFLRRRGYIERVPGRLISHITDAGRIALTAALATRGDR